MELEFENTLDQLSYFSILLRLLSGEFCSTIPDLGGTWPGLALPLHEIPRFQID